MAIYWEIVKDFPLLTKSLESDLLVYCVGSGDTHMLDSSGIVVLKLLENKAATLTELYTESLNNENLPTTGDELLEIVKKMEALGMLTQFEA